MCRLLDELVTADFVADDGIQLGPDEIHAYLQRVLYNRRNKCATLQKPDRLCEGKTAVSMS